jgi:hypothetical protein
MTFRHQRLYKKGFEHGKSEDTRRITGKRSTAFRTNFVQTIFRASSRLLHVESLSCLLPRGQRKGQKRLPGKTVRPFSCGLNLIFIG